MPTPSPGFADLLPALPALVTAGWTIINPTTSIAECRIAGSDDATYGTVGWRPRIDGLPFCVIYGDGAGGLRPETNRVWTINRLRMFLAVAQADAAADMNYNLLALHWIDAAWDFVAATARLGAPGMALAPVLGDVWWDMQDGKVIQAHPILGLHFYGAFIMTTVRVVKSVNYQT